MTPGAQAPFSPAARDPESDPGALAQHVAGLTAALEQIGVRSIAHPALADSPLLAAGLDYLLRRAAQPDAPPHPLPARVCWSRIRYRQHFRPAAAGCEHAAAMLGYLAAARAGPVEYLLADVSPVALERARQRLGDRRGQVTIRYLQLDLQQYRYAGLMPYRGRILTIHLTNMLDNLAGERLARVNGHHYLLHVQLYLPGAALRSLAAAYRLRPGQVAAAPAAIPTTGVERFLDEMRTLLGGGEDRLMRFWYDLYGNPALPGSGLKLLERLVEIPNLTRSEALPHELFGIGRLPRAHAVLGELLEAAGSDVWLPLSERAIIGCLRLFALLHPAGALEITDILLHEPVTHYAAYAGPAKYDGSVVEWVNGGLLQACARRVFPGCSFHAESLAAAGKPHVTRLVLRPRRG